MLQRTLLGKLNDKLHNGRKYLLIMDLITCIQNKEHLKLRERYMIQLKKNSLKLIWIFSCTILKINLYFEWNNFKGTYSEHFRIQMVRNSSLTEWSHILKMLSEAFYRSQLTFRLMTLVKSIDGETWTAGKNSAVTFLFVKLTKQNPHIKRVKYWSFWLWLGGNEPH